MHVLSLVWVNLILLVLGDWCWWDGFDLQRSDVLERPVFLFVGGMGCEDESESLILAQNERWRRA
jgi:hypothetical protein